MEHKETRQNPDVINQLALIGLVPVVKVENPEDAVPLCQALERGGLPVAEITFRTPAAREAIRLVHESFPQVLLGAGTVTTTQQAREAWVAGARFLVTPGMNPAVLEYALDREYTILPGCAGPSDIETALSFGVSVLKFFPAEVLGGVKMIRALLGPYHSVHFVPTGGITPQNLSDYLAIPQVLACGGSWMVPEALIRQQNWGAIETLAKEAVSTALNFRLQGITLYGKDEEDSLTAVHRLGLLTGWPIKLGSSSWDMLTFAASKGDAAGRITISTTTLQRAQWHLERRGFELKAQKQTGGLYLTEKLSSFEVELISQEAYNK